MIGEGGPGGNAALLCYRETIMILRDEIFRPFPQPPYKAQTHKAQPLTSNL